ncbi:MAG: hypothetical protein ACI9FN_000188 [Saprospiraceae bacterium]|jgi:hypothetical protein
MGSVILLKLIPSAKVIVFPSKEVWIGQSVGAGASHVRWY